MNRVTGVFTALACAFGALTATPAMGQAYPSKPIRIVVPFPPGGTVDIIGRMIGMELGTRLGVNVVIDNKAGAGGTIGTHAVALAAADGYTFLITGTHQVINPKLMKNLPYDGIADFTPIGMIVSAPSVLAVGEATGFLSVADVVRRGKEKDARLVFGSTGIGGVNHLTGELFKSRTKIDLTHVPDKGAAPARTDLLGGHIPMMFDSPPTVVPHVLTGKLRALAISGTERSPMLPDVPTLKEAGIAGMEALGFVGMFGPAKLPAHVVAAVSAALNGTMQSPSVQKKVAEAGLGKPTVAPADFSKWVRSEAAAWGEVIDAAGITVN